MIISVIGQKGGIGKSTMTICLGVAAIERGLRALLVDADPQGTVRTWADVANEVEGRDAHETPTVVAMGATMHRAGQLASLAGGYDLTIIDCPPRHGDIQRSALMMADVAVLPCGPSAADAWALAGTVDVVQEVRTLREELRACIVITRAQGRTVLGRGARGVLESSGFPVLSSKLESRVAYQEALAAGRGVTAYAPRDRAASEVRALLDEIQRFFYGQEARECFAPQAAAG